MISFGIRFFWRVALTLILITGIPCTGTVRAAEEKEAGSPENGDSADRKGLPLEPERKIEFRTDEGTWLSLDVSPDGTTIVFELLGDLYTLPIDGGEAARITSGMGFDSQPAYSPDGEWIAFISDREGSENVWISRTDGNEAKVLSKDESAAFASPTWTPDGQYVVTSRSSWGLATFELWMYHIQGGSGVQLTKAKSDPETPRNRRHNAIGPRVSPDGRYIYYSRKIGGFQYNSTFPQWQIARRDMKTGDEDVLTQNL
ncbi:MAG: LpqB family beta-propeller domain-containing protein, partial [Acidobacteriota bacterium]